MTEIFDNIRKLYQFKNPCFELIDYVEFFSESCPKANEQFIDSEEFTVKLFPSFTPTIWLNLGSTYQLKNGITCKNIYPKNDILVLRNTVLERKNHRTDHIFTIKFYPMAFEVVFGISQSKIGNDFIDVNEIISPTIIKKLKDLGSFEDRIALLENYFIEKLNRNRASKFQFECIKASVEAFTNAGLSLKNRELANDVCLTEKTFYRYFKNTIGTNPKHYLATVRARKALTAYANGNSGFSPIDFGYFDFGHFSKDVARFTGNKLSSFQ
ncbi:MAG: helix-turn-helix domain-containing protein, partial [Bacteroidota bacterium]